MLMRRTLTSSFAFSAVLGAFGNILAIFSTVIGNIHPQIAVDLSHIATVIAAFSLGPLWATLVGFLISIVPFIRFGFMGYLGPILSSLIFPGKALTGFFTGLIATKIRRPSLALLLGYVPESIFTWATFKLWIPILAPQLSNWISDAIVYGILIKAWIEILIIGIISEPLIPRVKRVIPYSFPNQSGN